MTPVKALAFSIIVAGLSPLAGAQPARQKVAAPHNVILFIADGLRAVMVDKDIAPTMAAIRDTGVNFRNSHSLFPTLTTANASGFATGHLLGDTGDWGNTIYSGFAVAKALDSVTPFIENDAVLGELDQHFDGDYLDEQTILAAARAAGFGTAAVGKIGPALIQDHTARDGEATIVIDDATGNNSPNDGPRRGIPLSQPVIAAMNAAGLPLSAPGTAYPNLAQQEYFTDAFTKVVLPTLKTRGKPFYAVFWSRDPDGTQHNQTDGKGALLPGINGKSSLEAIRNADHDLARIREALKAQGLDQDTDIIVAADHGFSTVYKESATSFATGTTYPDTPPGNLPNGFLAIDLSRALKLPLFDPDNGGGAIRDGAHPKRGNGLLGPDPAHPQIIVAANGGSDLIYMTGSDAKETAAKVVGALLEQDYASGIFVRDDLGPVPGTLPLSAIGLKGSAVTPAPAIVVNFKSFALGCDQPLKCTAEVADAQYAQGQGMHGSFSRADTYNFQAATGPDFKKGFIDTAPSSNADIAQTVTHILGLKLKGEGKQIGRILSEALTGGTSPTVKIQTLRSQPAINGLATVVNMQSVGEYRYFDAAGFANRTVGLIP